MSEPISWHRLFGLSLIDFFRGAPVTVEVEKDMTEKKQLLDVLLHRLGNDPLPHRLPDGFEDLATYNLITFKSYQEALDGWGLIELIGHYVNFRKQISPSMQDLLPQTDFRLYRRVCPLAARSDPGRTAEPTPSRRLRGASFRRDHSDSRRSRITASGV